MRLIDAEYLKEHVFACATNGRPLHHMELSELSDAIDDVPTIEPERKTGKWVGYDGDWLKTMCKCSECGAMIDINEKYRNFFCYHCGARMDGEQE